jgi:hypothetical protein
MGKVMMQKFLTGFTCESWDTQLEREWWLYLARHMGARGFLFVCVRGPFAAWGAKGEEEYP